MPIYRFLVDEGSDDVPADAVTLPDLGSAKRHAVLLVSEMLREPTLDVWSEGGIKVEVTDNVGLLLCSLLVDGFCAPVARKAPTPG